MIETNGCRGIRGATTVDDPDEIEGVTAELLDALVEANSVRLEDVAAAVFTVTEDLRGVNPAAAARGHGWHDVPLLCLREHVDLVPRCIRLLLLWNTSRPQSEIRHVYLRGTEGLRPDLAGASEGGS